MKDALRPSDRRIRLGAVLAGIMLLSWWAYWYPWGAVPAYPLYIYVPGMRECFSLEVPDNLWCTLISTSFVNGQFRPTQTWFFSLYFDPWTYYFDLQIFQATMVVNWFLTGTLAFFWLRAFQLPNKLRAISAIILMFSSSVVWYSAGSANADPLAIVISMAVALLWMRERQPPFWINQVITLFALMVLAGMSNTARITALMVLVGTVWSGACRASLRHCWGYVGLFVVLFASAELVEVFRRDFGVREANLDFAWALLSMAGMPFGAYLGTLFLTGRARWFGLIVVSAILALSSPEYEIDFGKGDALYVDYARTLLIGASTLIALVAAFRVRRTRGVWAFAVLNVGLILFAELISGTAQIDPNPRNFVLVQAFFALSIPLWIRSQWAQQNVLDRMSLICAATAVAYRVMVLIPIHFNSLAITADVEEYESMVVDYESTCAMVGSQYGNALMGRTLVRDAAVCNLEWIVQKERSRNVASFWQRPGVSHMYYQFTFGPKSPIIPLRSLIVPSLAAEWIDLVRTRKSRSIKLSIYPYEKDKIAISYRQFLQIRGRNP